MKVLLADDHGLFRSGMRHLLGDLAKHLQITEIASFAALNAADLSSFDLLLVDLNFSGQRITERIPELVVRAKKGRLVIISGEDSPEIVKQCIDAGAFGFVPKSGDQATLVPALRLVLSGGIYIPSGALTALLDRSKEFISPESLKARLTERQAEILDLALMGTPNKEIARVIGVAEGTVKAHLSKIYFVLGARNRSEAIFLLANQGVEQLRARAMY